MSFMYIIRSFFSKKKATSQAYKVFLKDEHVNEKWRQDSNSYRH